MRIKRILQPPMAIEDFADEHDLTMAVTERSNLNLPRFYAAFEHTEIVNRSVLIGEYGNGNTEEEAIRDYASKISKKRIAINAYRDSRRELTVPEVI